MSKLSAQQEAFALNIIAGMNQTDAYKAAGYKCSDDNVAAVGASNLIRNAKVALRIKVLQEEVARKAELSAIGFAKRLNRLAMAAERKALTEAETGDEFASKEAADVMRQSIMDAAKLLGLIIDQSKVQSENVNYNIGDTPLSPDEWEREFAADKDAVGAPTRTPTRPN
jgi:phage terminase small subunit